MRFRINYVRDGLVEEWHEGSAEFVLNLKRQEFDEFEEFEKKGYPFFLRSCAKPLQASLLADCHINLTKKELAFCSGSHIGEDYHLETARGIMKKYGLTESMLKCGIHAPLSRTQQERMLIQGIETTPIYNNCSGKHIGFLCICKRMGWDLKTYYLPEHPLQQAIKKKINKLCGIRNEYPMTTDGCGVPIVSMPLKNIAKGYIKLNENYPDIIASIKAYPYIFGGAGRTDTEIVSNSDCLIAKVGAGGLCVVLNYKTNEAFALKINDSSYEARHAAAFEIIKMLDWANLEYNKQITTLRGKVLGEISFVVL